MEPKGHASAEAVKKHRMGHLTRVKDMLKKTDVFVYTFGLTEAWIHRESGTVYPVAPGTIAGSYDESNHVFKNFGFNDIYSDFKAFRVVLKEINPLARFIITVSPVPLTATATDDYVLTATIYSKSVLRAVAGELSNEFDDVDYFPSYELIASHFSRGMFYQNNLRSVTQAGVGNAMRLFFSEHQLKIEDEKDESRRSGQSSEEDAICEEILLEAFGK